MPAPDRPSKILLVQVGDLIPVLLPHPSFGFVCFLSFSFLESSYGNVRKSHIQRKITTWHRNPEESHRQSTCTCVMHALRAGRGGGGGLEMPALFIYTNTGESKNFTRIITRTTLGTGGTLEVGLARTLALTQVHQEEFLIKQDSLTAH